MNRLYNDLKEEIQKGNALIIVGAGVSLAATNGNPLAGWTGLLLDGVDRCVELNTSISKDWPNRAKGAIESGDIDEIVSCAEVITRKLGGPKGGEFRGWLNETVGSLEAKNREVIKAIHSLGIRIATTNYDGLLEEGTGLPPITWMDGSKVQRVLRGEMQGIIHIHGHFDKPESVILGVSSYDKILNHELSQTILRTIELMKTVIFVGCGDGLNDPNFGALMEWTGKVLSGSVGRHYRLALKKDVETLQQQHPPEQRLFVIPYGEKHEDLAAFIKSLAPEKNTSEESPTPANNTVSRTPTIPSAPYCFGRDKELGELIDTLLSENPSPAPILGAPGIGKSTLVSYALRDERIKEQYGNYRYFIRCDGITTRTGLASEIARALGLEMSPQVEPVCLYTLETRPSIIVLDNFETPWEADQTEMEAFLGALTDISRLALIITMRGSVRPEGVRWRETIKVNTLDIESSRKAFLAIAGKSFENDPLLEELCELMEGVPLAINLIAHAAEGEPNLQGIRKRWEYERTAMLKYGKAADRSSNIEISYKLSINGSRMNRSARRTLSILALLPDGLARGNFPSVLPPDYQKSASILRQVGLAFDESNRLRLLAPLREYVRIHYPPEETNKKRLIKHYINLVKNNAIKMGQQGGSEAINQLSPEVNNIEFLATEVMYEYMDISTIKIFLNWGDFVRMTGMGSLRPLQTILKKSQQLKNDNMIAKCLYHIGNIEIAQTNYEAATTHINKAKVLFETTGDHIGTANCILDSGIIAFRSSNDHNKARENYVEALAIYAKANDSFGEANCSINLSELDLHCSDFNNAIIKLKHAQGLFKEMNNPQGEANCIWYLGIIAHYCSDYKSAHTYLMAANNLYNEVGDVVGKANHMFYTGIIAQESSDLELAYSNYERALILHRRTNNLLSASNCIVNIGSILLEKNECENANSKFIEAMTIIEKFGENLEQAYCQRHIANLNVKVKKYDEALENYCSALEIYNKINDLYGKGHCKMGFGDVATAKGEVETAQKHYNEALDLFEKMPNPFNIGHLHQKLARIASDVQTRKDHVQKAREIWEKIELPILLAQLKEEFPEDIKA